jgi:hypothetical protein
LEDIMLHALLATIGALAILASLAAKFVRLPVDATLGDISGPDLPSAHGARSHRRDRGRVRVRCKSGRGDVLARAVAD